MICASSSSNAFIALRTLGEKIANVKQHIPDLASNETQHTGSRVHPGFLTLGFVACNTKAGST